MFTAVPPLSAAKQLKIAIQRFWIRDFDALTTADDGREMAQADIDTSGRTLHLDRIANFHLNGQTYEPTICFASYSSRKNSALNLRSLFNTYFPKPRHLDMTFKNVNRAR